jgi:hypothetical protein
MRTPAGVERVKGLIRSYEASEKEQAGQQGRPVGVKIGGFESEVQHLPACKVCRCNRPLRTTASFNLKTASPLPA